MYMERVVMWQEAGLGAQDKKEQFGPSDAIWISTGQDGGLCLAAAWRNIIIIIIIILLELSKLMHQLD